MPQEMPEKNAAEKNTAEKNVAETNAAEKMPQRKMPQRKVPQRNAAEKCRRKMPQKNAADKCRERKGQLIEKAPPHGEVPFYLYFPWRGENAAPCVFRETGLSYFPYGLGRIERISV